MKIKKYFNSKTTLICFIVYLLLTAFIFYQSLLDTNESTESSERVSNLISKTLEIFTGSETSLKDEGKIKSLYPESIEVSGIDGELTIGKRYQITYKLLPSSDYALSNVEFLSSNPSVIAVDKDGVVSPLSVGTATVTVKDKFSGVYKDLLLTVNNQVYMPEFNFGELTGFSSEDDSVYYSTSNRAGAIYAISYQTNLEGDSLWVQSNDDVDMVLGKNMVCFYPKRSGEIDINVNATFTNVNGVQQQTYTYKLNVIEKELPSYSAPLTISQTEIYLLTNKTHDLTVDFQAYAQDLTDAQLRLFYKVDSDILDLSINENLLTLTPVSVGDTEICLYSVCNNSIYESKIAVHVIQGLPKSANIIATNDWAVNGKNFPLRIVGDGVRFDASEFNWTVDSDSATIQNGVFNCNKNGKYTVTAKHKTIENFTLTKTIEVKYSYNVYIRKIVGHFSLFFLLAFFAIVVYYRLAELLRPSDKVLLGTSLSLCAGLVTAVVAELLQSGIFTIGRGPSYQDVLIDIAGFLLSTCIYLIIYIIYRKAKKKNFNN